MGTLCLLGCVLAVAQLPPAGVGRAAANGEWLLTPRLNEAQELVYRGTFSESACGNVQFSREYRLENRVFVLESSPRGLDVAILTVLKEPRAPQAAGHGARLERVQVDAQGRVTPPAGVSLAVPLEGPPTLECGAFVPVPHGLIDRRGWTVTEPGRPEWQWSVAGTEMVKGTSCLKLIGLQQSSDWEQPRGGGLAWRRRDTVWVSPRDGVAHRLERVIERKLPLRSEPAQQSVLACELALSPRYPRQLVEAYRRDIEQALRFRETARPFLSQPVQFGEQLTALLGRIDSYLERQNGPTPYRAGLLEVRDRVEAARRGETPPALPTELTEPPATVKPAVESATVGQAAPDFAAPDFTNAGNSSGLRNWRGRPVLLVFYNPTSRNLDDLMRLVGRTAAQHRGVVVVGLDMAGDMAGSLRQRQQKGWTFPILDGTGLRQSYDVTYTPKLVLIDARGVVCGVVEGWGSNTTEEFQAELPRWLKGR
jgi:hypothetical protein